MALMKAYPQSEEIGTPSGPKVKLDDDGNGFTLREGLHPGVIEFTLHHKSTVVGAGILNSLHLDHGSGHELGGVLNLMMDEVLSKWVK
jgi:hypothetical protein